MKVRSPAGSQSQSKQTVPLSESFLATYKQHEGLPRLSRFTYIDRDLQITLKFTETGVFYKSDTVAPVETADTIRTKIFDSWVNEHRNGRSGYRKLSPPGYYPKGGSMDLFIAKSLFKSLSTANESEGKRSGPAFSFSLPGPIPSVVWIAPIRTRPRRTYDEMQFDYSPEGGHTPYVIRKILDSKKEANQFLSFIRGVGKSSGLFESISIRRYGRGVTAPFEVDIILDKKALNLSNVGYGVSQSLPVIVELFIRPEGSWFAIQQPEVHLHPRAQAALGDVFFDLAVREKKCFFVETHSDFTIDRFKMNFQRRKIGKPHSQILFFERKNGRNVISPLSIGSRGELLRKQPVSYRRFFLKEQLRSLSG